jgi:dihydromethanopterin reductase (acceptor)
MAKVKMPRFGWALTRSGHFFKECLRAAGGLKEFDLFVTKAASEVVRQDFKLTEIVRFFRDTTASVAPVGLFYYGIYHTLNVALATFNTVANCAFGISDTLVTKVFAQAGTCRVPVVKIYQWDIDLQNTERLKSFDSTSVVEQLEAALQQRRRELHG